METNAPAAPPGGFLHRQFTHPSGVLGALIGVAMAIEHRELHRAVVERLNLDSADRALETGFGPGTAIRLAAPLASFVAGIEPSREMVRQAARRNRAAIRSGRVELLRASVSAIPYPNGSFSVVFEVNSYHHWDQREAGLLEVFRVLRPGGRLLMSLSEGHGEPLPPQVSQVTRALADIGFSQVSVEEHRFGHGGAFLAARR
jgi:SAM-dependent methyltransferase